MGDRSFRITVVLVLCVAAAVGVWQALQRQAEPESTAVAVMLRFDPIAGYDPLVLNEPRYANPGGSGNFAVRDFQFFVSNIRLRSDSGDYIEPDSYHLVRFDGPQPVFEIALPDVPPRRYTTLEFGIGVDPAANGTIAQRGDLDPNGRMAWTWDVGYKFVLFEGRLEDGTTSTPLVYHVGYDENYRPVAASLSNVVFDDGGAIALDFRVDVLRLFTGDNTIDMRSLSTVKFDHADAARLARNYADMLTPVWVPEAAH